ncbi:hypothetical protein [Streptococcus suis]|uniref:hypothetical protein n=1 Tax=Streptococcus suis TaxID=1307 RepID=UPI0028754754|nr:hypothetical protein [Streptococcus suis]MDS1161645.1 hypothetical protein [Streptococcus suis]
MTLYEYDLLMTGSNLKEVDVDRRIHMQAFLNRQIKSVKDSKRGTPMYKTFDEFFDYEKAIRKITHETDVPRDKTAFDLLFKANTS